MTEILIHWHAGRSISEVSTSLNVDRKTIRKYLAPALAAGLTPGGPAVGQAEWAALVLEWVPHLADTSLRQMTWPEIATHHEYIVEQLKAGVTQATIHQRLRDERGLRACGVSKPCHVARAGLLCGSFVFGDQPAEDGPAFDPLVGQVNDGTGRTAEAATAGLGVAGSPGVGPSWRFRSPCLCSSTADG